MGASMDFEGRTAVVTGAASGIGRAVAVALAQAGATVAAADRNLDGARETAASLADANVTAHWVDLVDPASILALRDEVVDAHGVPDVLINAAGWDLVEPFMDNTDDFFSEVVAINYLGPVRISHAFLEPILAARAGAKIVNLASDAGRVGSTGETVYSGARGGVIAFTKSLARELARHSINVNCVCPGPTDTPLFATLPERIREGLVRAIPFRRLATPEEIADAVLFFASGRADFVTGQVLSVSGGLTMAG